MRKYVGILLLAVLMCSGLLAAEAASPAADSASKWDFIWGLEQVWKGIGIVGTTILTWLFKRAWDKDTMQEAEREAASHAEQAVIETYLEYVRDLKAGKADGKLTKDEARAARQRAVDKLMAAAKGPALNLLVKWGKPRVEAYIQKVVARMKAKGAAK